MSTAAPGRPQVKGNRGVSLSQGRALESHKFEHLEDIQSFVMCLLGVTMRFHCAGVFMTVLVPIMLIFLESQEEIIDNHIFLRWFHDESFLNCLI